MITERRQSTGAGLPKGSHVEHSDRVGEALIESLDESPKKRYVIRLPRSASNSLDQDEAYFFLEEGGKKRRIRFHDYGAIYDRPGLYEQIFYDRLKCTSPTRMAQWLSRATAEAGEPMQTLRVLDLGAGNGMMGEALLKYGVARMVGVDILPEAKMAAERDRPGIYDAYYVEDFTALDSAVEQELAEWNFDCLTTVAALGFGDIPPKAFTTAFNLVRDAGWICLNIKATFLSESDQSGFSTLVRRLLLTESLELHRMVRYRHRYSIDGVPLIYFGIIGRKRRDIA